MSDIFLHIYTYLTADLALVGTQASPPAGPYSGLLSGGLWRRPLKRASDPTAPTPPAGATPAAFGGAGPEAGRMRYAAVMLDQGERTHGQDEWIPTAMTQEFTINFYAPAHDAGKKAILDAENMVYDLLYNYRFQTDNGPFARVFYLNRVGIIDSEEFLGCVTDYCRYAVVYRKREAKE